jgi:hypothetical protein
MGRVRERPRLIAAQVLAVVVVAGAGVLIGMALADEEPTVPAATQARLDRAERPRVTILVDEFQTMPGADYEAILAELAKYGANLVLATQSLARLAVLDRVQQRALQATVFANLDGLFAFHTSAEDARYLCRELGDGLDEQDLVELGDYQCYARVSARGERLPAFSVSLEAPPPSDPTVRDQLVAASAARYGRAWSAVEADIRSALARIELARQAARDESESHKKRTGADREFGKNTRSGERSSSARARSDHREPKIPGSTVQQGRFWPDAASAAQQGDPVPAEDAVGPVEREEVTA